MSGHLVEFGFTTYDGNRYSIPYYDEYQGYYYISRELKKIGNLLYYTDYFSFVDGYLDDYGEISLNLGSSDSDNNGIDDICEKSKSVNNQISGNWYSCTSESGGISGSIYKNLIRRVEVTT